MPAEYQMLIKLIFYWLRINAILYLYLCRHCVCARNVGGYTKETKNIVEKFFANTLLLTYIVVHLFALDILRKSNEKYFWLNISFKLVYFIFCLFLFNRIFTQKELVFIDIRSYLTLFLLTLIDGICIGLYLISKRKRN